MKADTLTANNLTANTLLPANDLTSDLILYQLMI